MKTVLQAPVQVHLIATAAELAMLESRPELQRLCATAARNEGRLSVEIIDEALPGLSEAARRNLMRSLEYLRLVRNEQLTDLGRRCAETGEAPVPEQGIYWVWLCAHELTGIRILHVEREKPNPKDRNYEDLAELPLPIRSSEAAYTSVISRDRRVVLRKLFGDREGPRCRLRPHPGIRMRWDLDFDTNRNRFQLEGDLQLAKAGAAPIAHGAESVPNLDLSALFGDWLERSATRVGRWEPSRRLLRVPFVGLTDEELASFEKTVEFPEVVVPPYGRYERVSVTKVPIAPEDAKNAQRWTDALFAKRLGDERSYLARADVRRLFASVVENTELEPFNPVLPSHNDLLDQLEKDGQRALWWALAAAVDLAPEPVPSGQLDELRIGAAPAAVPAVPSDHVYSLSEGERRSMREMAAALVDGVTPRWILLCDKFVRGEQNLQLLQLFVEAVRAKHARSEIHIVTERNADEPDQWSRIRAIVGREPKAYGDVFGRKPPHDRYLLVRPETGDAFAWHMTNSPLAARIRRDETPTVDSAIYRRDLLAVRRRIDQIPAALRNLLA